MQSANLSGPLKGLRPYQALIGPTQASGLAGGFVFGLQSGYLKNANVGLLLGGTFAPYECLPWVIPQRRLNSFSSSAFIRHIKYYL